ncbi:MAG: UDP-N-acetylglucosamine--LPS N-acetylglucosamine transferase [Firmicutes bacterium HGW-Firmicutes-15]|nr:MAG: UDP-N-acetylglucosamine--LPS N-acetylglucosamine transferase [Firmicutes bacterium HGW-Firmicutes-15]
MKNLRVLIFSATFGAGHVRAAEALIESIRKINPSAEVKHLDCWAILSKNFNAILTDFYIGMIKRTPKIWGRLYYGTARISSDSILQRFLNNTGHSKYLEYIHSFQPELIICTYPTVAGVIARLKVKKIVNIPLVVVITDYTVHNQWIHSGVDLYIVGSTDIYNSFVSMGINAASIKVTGIPVSPKFECDLDRSQIMANLGLLPNLPTCLIMGGAYGVLSELRELCKTLAGTLIPSQSIVVCGQDKHLYKSLDDVIDNARNPMVRYGYVRNVDELMSAADIVITKAGGLTVSEALTKRLPIIIYKPIPGQEQENAAFLERIGAGRTANTRTELERILLSLLEHPEKMESMRHAAANALPGHAADRAVQHMLELVEESTNSVQVR